MVMGLNNVDTQTPLGMMRRQVTCDVCHGTGQEIKDPCPTCRGTGREKQSHTVSVKIPAGVETGQQIRLAGQGEAGFNGGPYGDLFVVINVNPSDKFTRDGSTIYYTLNISFVQAALGDTVEVPTFTVMLRWLFQRVLKQVKLPSKRKGSATSSWRFTRGSTSYCQDCNSYEAE